MEKSRLERKVGLFVGLGLALLAALLVYFSKGASLFRGTYILNLHAANVGGLKQQSTVQLAGVNVGSVHQIKLDASGTNVTIELQIYREYPIYHDARFVIEEAGFLGDHYISVIPTTNSPPVLTNGADVECESPFNLQEVARSAAGFVQRLDETARKLDASVTDLRAQVLNAETLANFGNTITNLRRFTEEALVTVHDIQDVIGTNRDQISLMVSNAGPVFGPAGPVGQLGLQPAGHQRLQYHDRHEKHRGSHRQCAAPVAGHPGGPGGGRDADRQQSDQHQPPGAGRESGGDQQQFKPVRSVASHVVASAAGHQRQQNRPSFQPRADHETTLAHPHPLSWPVRHRRVTPSARRRSMSIWIMPRCSA